MLTIVSNLGGGFWQRHWTILPIFMTAQQSFEGSNCGPDFFMYVKHFAKMIPGSVKREQFDESAAPVIPNTREHEINTNIAKPKYLLSPIFTYNKQDLL